MEKGERPTKYFFNLEGRNYNKETISELRIEDKKISKTETQVVDAIEIYFKDLNTSASSATQEEYYSFIQELCLPKLSDEERDDLEGLDKHSGLRNFSKWQVSWGPFPEAPGNYRAR